MLYLNSIDRIDFCWFFLVGDYYAFLERDCEWKTYDNGTRKFFKQWMCLKSTTSPKSTESTQHKKTDENWKFNIHRSPHTPHFTTVIMFSFKKKKHIFSSPFLIIIISLFFSTSSILLSLDVVNNNQM